MKKNDKIIAEALAKAYRSCTTIQLTNGVKLAQDQIKQKLSINDSEFDETEFDDYIDEYFESLIT